MAIFIFECNKCGNKIEKIQKFTDPIPTCKCGEKMVRTIQTSAFILKGSGWYKDGYSNTVSTDKSN